MLSRIRALPGMRSFSLLVAALIAVGGYAAVFSLPNADAQTSGPTYTACVSRYTGQVRVIFTGNCTAHEVPVEIGTGEPGPAGPPGPPGPVGPAGPPGGILAAYNAIHTTGSFDPPIGTATSVPFDTEQASIGNAVTTDSTGSSFTLAEAGLYRIEFTLQVEITGGLTGDISAQVLVNSVAQPPEWFASASAVGVSTTELISGELLVFAEAGDVVEISVFSSSLASIMDGSGLIITQLSAASTP